MSKVIVEYLVISPRNDSFCDSVDAFNKLLQVDSAIIIREGKITYQGNSTYQYQVTGDEVTGRDQRYYHLKFTLESKNSLSDQEIEEFTIFLKSIRSIIIRFGAQIETLWDDVSFYYSQKAYPLIYEIENLMRKLIANFMLITIGKDWVSETSPAEVQEAINRSKRRDYTNVLHTIDFIDLGSFLIKPYSKRSTQDLYNAIKKMNDEDNAIGLQEFLPKSNWQRYFSNLVSCEDTYLNKRWTELYELRCKVAHNAIVAKVDYDRIYELVNDLREKLIAALEKLPQVQVPKDEKETVAENAASNISNLYGDFITTWKLLERRMMRLAVRKNLDRRTIRKVIEAVHQIEFISDEQYQNLVNLYDARNRVIHATDVLISESELRDYIRSMVDLVNSIEIHDEIDELFPD